MMRGSLAYDGPRTDTHLHLWERGVSDYAWLSPADELFADFPAALAEVELAGAGIDRAVLVQADDTERDTRYLLDVADQNDWVAGVVGWVPLADPVVAAARLDGFAVEGALRGVREMIHVSADRDYLTRSDVRESLTAIAARDLAFDIPDAWPNHLHAVPALADALPDLTIVLDHLGKPPSSTVEYAHWRELLAECAARPNVVAKFSGLSEYSRTGGGDSMRALLNGALDAFGSERICWGSDWPISTKFDDYGEIWSGAAALIAELSASEQRDILFGTAARTYRLDTRDEL
ncbi:MAG: L-fuconolactonase [Actinomycetota bacterium]|nr:L-fuconolactonase [Actinomycetota bacterium]